MPDDLVPEKFTRQLKPPIDIHNSHELIVSPRIGSAIPGHAIQPLNG
jgi:hypothetical protein